MQTFLGVHDSKIKGTLSGFDRVRFRGTLRMLANTKGLSCFLSIMGVLLKDFRQWSMDLTERIRRATAELAGLRQRPIIYLCSCHTDKEAIRPVGHLLPRSRGRRDKIAQLQNWRFGLVLNQLAACH